MYVSILCRRFSKGGRKLGFRFQHLFIISYLKFNNDGLLFTTFYGLRKEYKYKVLLQEPFIENSIGNDSDLFWDVEHICTTSLALIFFKQILMS